MAAALSYAIGWVSGLFFLLTVPGNRFVRFHAMQSTIVFGAVCVLLVLLRSVPILGMLLSVFVLVPASAILWLVLIYKAYQGEHFKLPVAGDMAEHRI